MKIKVYILLNDSKSCYDAGGIFEEVFLTREAVDEYLSHYDKRDRASFSVEEYELEK